MTGRSMRRRAVILLTAVVATLAVIGGGVLLARVMPSGADTPGRIASGSSALPTGEAVPRSPSTLARYGAIAGSASWLLYAQTTRDDTVPVLASAQPYPRNPRYLLDARGTRIAVPREAAVSLLGDRPLLLQLATPQRFEYSGLINETGRSIELRWRMPVTGGSGTATLAAHSSVGAFGPDASWVTAMTVGHGQAETQNAPIDRLTQHFTSGRQIDLGIPFPLGAPSTLLSSASGLIAYSAAGDGGDYLPNGQIRFHPWSAGSWRTLNPGDPPQGEIDCSPATRVMFFCGVAGASGVRNRTLLFDLRTGTASVMHLSRTGPATCAVAQAATDTAFLGIVRDERFAGVTCPVGRLSQLSTDGTVILSDRRYDEFHSPVVAFGHIIVDEYREHRLLAVATVRGTPQVVVGR